MSNGTATTTMPSFHDDHLNGSGLLAASTGSLPSSRHQTSQIAKTYRQAAQLFLTRRLPEALSTIEPVITPEPVKDGEHNGGNSPVAPIATASRGTRIKVWSFYLTFINSVVELGAEEGKHAFGSTKWKQLVNKARDGTIWEDIVRDGYSGNEGAVDADVVINLATLLLTHSPSQKLNQQRLETYLSAISHPSFDITTSHLTSPRLRRTASSASGTNTPRDLHASLKLLELYTLHVLPRNQEWEYAREFIMMSEVLDDERKEAFLQALHGLKQEQEENKLREKELQKQQQLQLEQQRKEEEKKRIEEERRREENILRKEEARRTQQHRPPDSPPNRKPTSSLTPGHGRADSTTSPPSRRKKEIARRPPPASFYARAQAMFTTLQTALLQTAQNLSQNPMALMRAVLFLLMFALAFGRRDLRERVRRMVQRAWEKVRGTVGMGVKVSYI